MGLKISDPKKDRSWQTKDRFGAHIFQKKKILEVNTKENILQSQGIQQQEQEYILWVSVHIQKVKNFVHQLYAISRKAEKIP